MMGSLSKSTGSPERRTFRMAGLRARPFIIGSLAWSVFFVFPIAPAKFMESAYNELDRNGATSRVVVLGVVVVALEIAMAFTIRAGHAVYSTAFDGIQSIVRANVLRSQLSSGGEFASPRRTSSGDMVTRLRDDPTDMLTLTDNWVDVVGALTFATIATVLLMRVDVLATLALLTPIVLFGGVTRLAGNRFRKYRIASREATSQSTNFLNAAFGSALTVKLGGTSSAVLRRIDQLNAKRSKTMVRDLTAGDALWQMQGSVGDIALGSALVVAARRLPNASDVALFATLAVNFVWLPQRFGGMLVQRRRFEVAAKRLDVLVAPAAGPTTQERLIVDQPMPILGGPAVPPIVRPTRVRLETLTIRGLTVEDRRLDSIDLTIRSGTLTVISGPVGSGKSSLLLALLGLIDIDAGTFAWNGALVEDRAAFFVPPHCAYVAQVPHLFSETLRDNLLLGAEADPTNALRLAAFDADVAHLHDGLETPIGASGVRLSGGQAQRAAAARALVHDSELIVFDDLTSALDVETELLLWDRLAEAGRTVLAVSNRPVAIARADQHLRLESR